MFDLKDMARAKEIIGPMACIAGNVPLSLLCTASPDDVKAYCKELIDVAGEDGGFIFSTGEAVDDKVSAYAGADAYGPDAVAAVSLSKE